MSKHIGEQLKKARENKKWTQEDMAKKLDISSRQVQKYEDGIFPKYKGDKIKEMDSLLGTNFYEQIYEQGVQAVEETKKPAPQGEEGLKEDLIAALKMNNALLEARVRELEGRTAPPPSIETGTADHLSRIRADMNYLMSLAVGYSKRALELQVPDKKKFLAEVRTIQQSVIADPEALLRQGTSLGTDDN